MCLSVPAKSGNPISRQTADSLYLYETLQAVQDYSHAGNLGKAMEMAQEVVESATDLKYPYLQGLAEFQIGLIFLKMEDTRHGIARIKQAYTLFKSIEQKQDMTYCLANMAIAYGMTRKYDSCISMFEELAGIYSKQNDSLNLAKTLINISHAYFLNGNYEKSLEKIKESYFLTPSQTTLAKDFHLMKGLVLKKTGQCAEAEKSFDTAYQIAKEKSDYAVMAIAAREKAGIMEEAKNYKEAMIAYKQLNLCSDSLNLIKHNKEVYEIENRYRLEKKDRDLALLSREKKIAEQKAIIVVSLLMAILFAIALLVLRIKNKYYKSTICNIKLQEKINKNRQTMSNLDIQGQEGLRLLKILKQNIDNLSKQEKNSKGEYYFAINRTVEQISQILEKQSFSLDDKNNAFTEKLTKHFPQLSPMERKTCMLLYIDFSTKDIAEAFHLSEKSVNNTRWRIRKKLSVPNEMPLADFLRRFMEEPESEA